MTALHTIAPTTLSKGDILIHPIVPQTHSQICMPAFIVSGVWVPFPLHFSAMDCMLKKTALIAFAERSVILKTDAKSFYWPILSNSGPTSCRPCKARRHLELFFKPQKQSLKIKTFADTSKNPLRFPSWTALSAMLLLKYLQLESRQHFSPTSARLQHLQDLGIA
jgi:hypothetical protein